MPGTVALRPTFILNIREKFMYPIIPFQLAETRSDLFRSWLDQRAQYQDDPLVKRAFYYSKNEEHGHYAGEAELQTFAEQTTAFDSDLLLIVTAGSITLGLNNGETLVVEPQQSVVIPRGADVHWQNEADTRVWFVAYQPEQTAEAVATLPFKVDADASLASVAGPSAELITSEGYPDVHRHVVYISADGKFSVGIWQATAYTRRLAAFGDYELMYPVQGEITITNALGESHTYGAYDGFIVNRGVSNAWHSSELVKKIYSKVSV